MTFEDDFDELVEDGLEAVGVAAVVGAAVYLLSPPQPAARPARRCRIHYVPIAEPARPIGLLGRIAAALKGLATLVKRALEWLARIC